MRAWELGQRQDAAGQALVLLSVLYPEQGPDALALIPLGERDQRLLAARERLFGPHLDGYSECPHCGERLEYRLSTADLMDEPTSPVPRVHEWQTDGLALRFRLPTSLDLLYAARCASVGAVRRTLAERCLLEPDAATAALSEEAVSLLAGRMAAADPRVETLLDLVCPACDHRWQVIFDIAAFLWTELAAQARQLLREVHLLAQAYGWGEAEILQLSPPRRQFYLELVQR